MTHEELRKIGLVQLEIMDEVHRICNEENITYYMIGGTLLGSVRHSGFIPWDLDIDIGMLREEYDRFKIACKTHLSSKYSYIDHTNFRYFLRPHALVTRKDTKIHIKYDHLNPKLFDLGIYIDVFPLDNAPDDPYLRIKQAKHLKRIKDIKESRIPYAYSYKRWKRYLHYIRSTLLFWIPIKRLNHYQQKIMQKYRNYQTKCICSMGSQYAYSKQCMPREIYGSPILLEFEGRKYYAPEKYKEYLSRLYGNYMELPPEEKRQSNLQIFTSVEFMN